MYKVQITPHWTIGSNAGQSLDMSALLGLLASIQKTGSIAQAAQTVGLSYRYAWGLLREGEQVFNEARQPLGLYRHGSHPKGIPWRDDRCRYTSHDGHNSNREEGL